MADEPQKSHGPIYKDRSFLGMLVTQFLGAFNDNVFKQILLFVCIDFAAGKREADLQGLATTVFAIPFIILSGYCGFLSDKLSKRNLIVTSKVLEIVVMGLGGFAFLSGNISIMMAVLFLMGAQSALFGPSKYGILPELFSEKDLPRVNGWILMTTFLSIILGFAISGEIKEALNDDLWKASYICVGIAIVGTLTALMVRKTPIANPDAKFEPSTLIVNSETRRLIFKDRRLLWTLVATSVFWTTGGVVYPNATNDLGIKQFGWGEAATGRLAACTGIGIALGCLVAGYLSRNRFNGKLVRFGAIGMFLGLIVMALPSSSPATIAIGVPGAIIGLIWLGFCAGLFTVPLQVFLQTATPRLHKGRIIGAMNLANWIGMAMAGVYYSIWNQIFAIEGLNVPYNAMYGAAALLLLPLVLFYRPESVDLNDISSEQSELQVAIATPKS
ncbi:MFS transporter [Thalassoglobus sp.]|uniref:MFS transporter n=1 Tax=Thalassoglobus sp. TaxID=2795869 RepID=UPI003AA8AC92